jgi:hypothetical protein
MAHPDTAPAIASAREKYVDQLGHMLDLYDQLGPKLSQLETESTAASRKLDEIYKTLDDHLQTTNIASTVGSAVSIVGTIMIFTPLAPVGIGLVAAGVATNLGSNAVAHYSFESDAADGFKDVVDKYTIASQALSSLLQDIENTKTKMAESLTVFLALLATQPPPDPSTIGSGGAPGPGINAPQHIPNGFSQVALQGAVLGAAGAKPLTALAAAELTKALGKRRSVYAAKLSISLLISSSVCSQRRRSDPEGSASIQSFWQGYTGGGHRHRRGIDHHHVDKQQ